MYKLFKRTHIPGRIDVLMAGACDPGIARDHNEDAICLQEDDGRGYYFALVCDGMGGHNAGEVASAIAIVTVQEHLEKYFDPKGDHEELLSEAFLRASRAIDAHAAEHPDAKGMGCTAVCVLGVKGQIVTAHAGDSRAYRVRGDEISSLTLDHTMVQEMVNNGLITTEQAAVHPYRGRISRCLGHGKNKGDPTVNKYEFEVGDNVLLCSDGLSDVVNENEIRALASSRDVRSSVRRLVEGANAAGGPDNISAMVLRRVL
jgi:protein phosphatase